MAIPPENTFVYEATVASESFRPQEIVLEGQEGSGRPGPWPLGPKPKITVRDERVVLLAGAPQDAREWYVSLPAGEALTRVLRPEDTLMIKRTISGGHAISVRRQGEFLLGLGSVIWINLGPEVRVTHGPPFGDSAEPPRGGAWLEFEVSGQRHRLHERDIGRLGSYRVYLEQVPGVGDEGKECVAAVARLDDEVAWIAAVRSAIFLAHGELKVGDWGFFSKIE